MRLSWPRGLSRALGLCAPVLASLAIAGCSNSSRLAGPSWNLTGGKDAVPQPSQPINPPARQASPPALEARPLPPVATQPRHLPPTPMQAKPGPSAAAPSQHRTVAVRPGQSLAAIAGEHRVSIAALMQVNALRDAYVVPGQQLIIPR